MSYRFLRFPGGKAKAVTLSYDDGDLFDLRLADIVERHGLKCTFNINSRKMLGGAAMTVDHARDLLSRGHEIAVHGAKHLANGLIRPIEGIQEVLECRIALENALNRIIRGMAYPDSGILRFCNTATYENICRYLADLGIAYSRTLGGDNNSFALPTDWYAWMPTAHHTSPDLMQYMDEFLALDIKSLYRAQHYPRLFYLWGHAFEFNRDQNWELLDEISRRLGGHEEIWYATNIEIHDYVKAYEALIFSADSKRIYNPTLIPIWFAVGADVHCVQPGETILIP